MEITDTSQAAKQSIRTIAATIRAEILLAITDEGYTGMTCDEVEAARGFSHQTASARINELRKNNDIYDSGRRRATRSGRDAIVWVAHDPMFV